MSGDLNRKIQEEVLKYISDRGEGDKELFGLVIFLWTFVYRWWKDFDASDAEKKRPIQGTGTF